MDEIVQLVPKFSEPSVQEVTKTASSNNNTGKKKYPKIIKFNVN